MESSKIIFFDGECNLCNAWVRFVIRWDSQYKFKFSALQSNYAKEILSKRGLQTQVIDTIVFVDSAHVWIKSDAALRILKDLGGFWGLIYYLRVFPKRFRNWVYDIIARNRYGWFGKRDSCMVPTAELKNRFLE